MASTNIYAGIVDDDDSFDHDSLSIFEVGLEPKGDPESGYHTKNDPRPEHQWHREDVTQRKGAIGVKCNMTDVIHGKWSDNNEKEYGTLIVFLFRFDVRKNCRNITRAEITIDFNGQSDNEFCRPEVYNISFNDNLSLMERSQSDTITQGVSGTAGLTPAQLAELSGTLKWEKTTTKDVLSYTTIIGNTYRNGYTFGGDNQVNWILKENDKFHTGVPAAFRAAVLLKRSDQQPFTCDVKIDIKADIRSFVEDFFGSCKPKDDSVLFNPKAEVPIRKFAAVDPEKLDVINLKDFDPSSIAHVSFFRHEKAP
ncbi:hypothetical protein E8E14_008720 [Neopestalotiopsis sp. 37M]|nr:hypothetical protein E8E14_008720 [Neopestalotiopsis sp. 37M]